MEEEEEDGEAAARTRATGGGGAGGGYSGELCLMDKAIGSLLEVSLSSKLHTINLHCNNISKIEGLSHVLNLRHLDLSSNQISQIEGLNTLTNLCTLNLACNFITKVEGLEKLFNLTRLNLSYNHIHDVQGFLYLRGTRHKISHIDLHSNYISSIHHLLQCMVGLHFLTNLTLEKNGKNNPICDQPGYRGIILQTLPQLTVLDGMNIFGEPVYMVEGNPSDLQCLEDLLDNLVYSDSQLDKEENSGNLPGIIHYINQEMPQDQKPASTPTKNTFCPSVEVTSSEPERNKLGENNLNSEMRIKKLEDQISQLLNNASNSPPNHTSLKVVQPKRETITSESDYESGKENHKKMPRRTKIHHYSKAVQTSKHHNKSKLSDSGTEQSCTKKSKNLFTKNLSLRSTSRNSDLKMERSTGNLVSQSTQTNKIENKSLRFTEDSTYRILVQKLDEEREKRWKAEQAEKKLADHIKELQKQVKEEKDIHSMALFTTDRLKELILKERNAKVKLQNIVHKFKSEIEKLHNELNQSKNKEEEQNRVLRTLEQTLTKIEKQKFQQQVAEVKRVQEIELKASAAEREIQLLRASLHQQKEKVQQLHELLTMKEQEHRKELETRVTLNGSDFQEALAKEIEKEEKKHEERVKEFQDKINILNQQYLDLEDEFRMALTIEAKRFKEVKDGFENISAELAKKNHALVRAQQKENESSILIQDLTSLVKEQKARIAEVSKSQLETTNLKNRIHTLETMIEEDKQKSVQIELLKQEKSQLTSQLTAQESILDGLKAERKLWGQELAQQGASLAQNCGKLEAKIEVLTTENESLRKLSECDSDSLKIKVKIIEDQTETIRKLKENLQERDDIIRRLREEIIEIHKNTQEQLDEKAAQLEELMEKLEQQCERKEDLKQQLKEKEAELEEIEKAYSAINKKWQDKGELLSGLEVQVKQMKEKFETKEKKLIEERDKSLQNQKATMERLHSVDDSFRKQLESMVAAHQAELLQLANEKQKQIDAANEKVSQVEDEMRQLLHETARNKKAMEEKIKRLTFALSDIQQEF